MDISGYKNLSEIGEDIKNKRISVEEVVNNLLKHIKEKDKDLNSFITVNSQILEEAREMDNEIRDGYYRGVLHGVPIGLKDLIQTKNMRTTMGSPIYEYYMADEDAYVVQKLKEAGAIIIGKLNTHQFAYGPTGDRSYFGPVHNPYDFSKMTGGSSSGSGAAVASGLAYGTLGTDTGGSIRIPASFCGVVGMKPTYGTVSKRGVYPLSWTLDHVGPMTRTIRDNALLLNVLANFDKEDPDAVFRESEDFTREIGRKVSGLSIGIPNQFYFDNLDKEIDKSIQHVISLYKKIGVTIIPVDMPSVESMNDAHKIILRNDALAIHKEHLQDYPDLWDDELKERLYTAFNDKGIDYARAMREREQSKQLFNKVLSDVDALLTPTMSIMPPKINERYVGGGTQDENHIRWTITKLTSPTDLNGFPSLSLPCGFSSTGMPIGVQLIGKMFDEAKLYQLGEALEQELGK